MASSSTLPPRSPHPSTPQSSPSPLHRLPTFNKSSSSSSASQSLSSSSPLSALSSDPTLAPFLSPTFSPTLFTSSALSSGVAASTLEKLHSSIQLLDSLLRHEVLSRHSDLLFQLSSLHAADHTLSTVRSSVSSLQSSLRRIRSELSDPRNAILSKTAQLSNLHSATELLQHTIRALRLSRKLREIVSAADSDFDKVDLTKGAQLHCEILGIVSEYGLAGIDVVDEEVKWVRDTGEKLRAEAMRVLERGMEGLNQAEVGTGLQVFYNLGELKGTVELLVNKYKGIAVKSVSSALDMRAVSSGGGFGPGGIRGSGTPAIGGGAKAREGLWQRMGGCMDQLCLVVVAVWHLQRVLSKKRDPFTHVLLLDEVIQVRWIGSWGSVFCMCVYFVLGLRVLGLFV